MRKGAFRECDRKGEWAPYRWATDGMITNSKSPFDMIFTLSKGSRGRENMWKFVYRINRRKGIYSVCRGEWL